MVPRRRYNPHSPDQNTISSSPAGSCTRWPQSKRRAGTRCLHRISDFPPCIKDTIYTYLISISNEGVGGSSRVAQRFGQTNRILQAR
jgi:hypothetical protein